MTTHTITVYPGSSEPSACVDSGSSGMSISNFTEDVQPGDTVNWEKGAGSASWWENTSLLGLTSDDANAKNYLGFTEGSLTSNCSGQAQSYYKSANNGTISVSVGTPPNNCDITYRIWGRSSTGDWFYDPELDITLSGT